jgi:asparaginyl-tRNA synthetase
MRSILIEGFSNRLSDCSDLESSGRLANKFSTRIVILPLCEPFVYGLFLRTLAPLRRFGSAQHMLCASHRCFRLHCSESVRDTFLKVVLLNSWQHLIDIAWPATRVDILALYSILQIMNSQYISVKQAFNLAVGSEITLRGWVRSRRDSKGVTFIELNDGSRFKSMQLVVDAGVVPDETLKQITTGSSIAASGQLVESPAKGQAVELKVNEISVYGTADPVTYPLQKKGHTLEFLRDIGHLRVRSNTFGAAFRVRNALTHAIHTFFQERDFIYVQTPIITTSDCEGAGQMFNVTSLSLANPPRTADGNINWQQDFFGRPAYLTVSGQLEGEIFALAFSKIYTFGPTFRAENSNTPRHLAEFWMIEPEMAFYELKDNMALAEEFLKFIIRYVLEHCPEDLEFFNERIEKTVLSTLEHVAESKFGHITYTDAIQELKKSGRTWEFPVEWGVDLQTEHERFLSEELFKKPVIVTDYPKDIKAFYMRVNDDNKTVRAMDVLVPRVGEIIGGSQREDRHDVLLQRLRDSGLDEKAYWWYFDLRRYGSVPHSGFGLGLERMMMYLTGLKNIRDVIPFPRTPGNADF